MTQSVKKKKTAVILVFLLGGFGAHHFYLGNKKSGIVYLLFFWTLVPYLIAIYEGVKLIRMSDELFNAIHNRSLHNKMENLQEQLYEAESKLEEKKNELIKKYGEEITTLILNGTPPEEIPEDMLRDYWQKTEHRKKIAEQKKKRKRK